MVIVLLSYCDGAYESEQSNMLAFIVCVEKNASELILRHHKYKIHILGFHIHTDIALFHLEKKLSDIVVKSICLLIFN